MGAGDTASSFNRGVLLILAGAVAMLGRVGVVGAVGAVTLYVATDGRPGWSGTLADPKPDGSDGPLGSVQAARDLIRQHRAKGKWLDEAITVTVRCGTYFLDEPLGFEPQDSGAKDKPVTYVAFGGETPILSGGRRVSDWHSGEVNGKPCWVTSLAEVQAGRWYFRQLFVNGQRRPRPRVPAEGWYQFTRFPPQRSEVPKKAVKGKAQVSDEACYRPGDMRNWHNLGDVEFVYLMKWDEAHLFAESLDEATQTLRFTQPSYFGHGQEVKDKTSARYYMVGVFEALDEPGEWYLDCPAGQLYYLPKPGEAFENTQVIAARLPELVRISGGAGGNRQVHDIHFKGLTFCHADWFLPADQTSGGQAGSRVAGALVLEQARDCRITDCTVTQISDYAIELTAGCQDIVISGCTLTDLGAGGVKVGHDSHHNTVTDNEIANGGLVQHGAAGIWIGHSWDNTVAHNHIHDLFYTGISVGWTWGYRESKAKRNLIEYNHIHDIGKRLLSDMGGIYTLGPSEGTRLHHNLIHDVQAFAYGGFGLYNDEGSTGILLENNIVYRTSHSGYHLNYGRENVIRNNIFAYGEKQTVDRSGQEKHLSFTFERNIVYITMPRMFDGEWRWDKGNFKMDHNLYWREGGQAFDFPGDRTFEQWQQWWKQDEHSLIADPLLVDPQNGDFRLKPGSPAEKIGFEPIDSSKIGRLTRR